MSSLVMYVLTKRERVLLDLVAVGYTVRQMAERLALNERTIKRDLDSAQAKLAGPPGDDPRAHDREPRRAASSD